MLGSLIRDLGRLAGLETRVLRDARLPKPEWENENIGLYPVASAAGCAAAWEQACAAADAVWPIAPESGGILEGLCRDVVEGGKILLNSPPEAVRLTAGKRRTCEWLRSAGVEAVPSHRLAETPEDCPWPRVVKPDDGVGCEKAFLWRAPGECNAGLADGETREWTVQPFVSGEAMSLSALFCRGEGRLLTVNRQHIRLEDSSFVLRGCRVGGEGDERGIHGELVGRIARALPGLWGYAGVDFIRGENGPVVLEVNPRLTTSWAGLADALGANPAALVLELARGRPLGTLGIPAISRPVEVVF